MRICFLIAIFYHNSVHTRGGQCPLFGSPSEDYDRFTACFMRIEEGVTWFEASQACGNIGAHLAFPYDRRELDVLLRLKYTITKSVYPNLSQARQEDLLLFLNARRQNGSDNVVAELSWNRLSPTEVAAIRQQQIPGYGRKVAGVWYNEPSFANASSNGTTDLRCAAHLTSDKDATAGNYAESMIWVSCSLTKASTVLCRRAKSMRTCSLPLDLLTSAEHAGGISRLYVVDLLANYLTAGYPVVLEMAIHNRSQLTSLVPSDWGIAYGSALLYSCSSGWYADEDRTIAIRQYVCAYTGWMQEENSSCRFYDGCAADKTLRGLSESICSGRGYCKSLPNATTSCSCLLGYHGGSCERRTDPCASSPCGLLGECHDLGADFYCVCHGSYSAGSRSCDTPISECALLHPCANGATCEERDVGYRCRCPLIVQTDGENVQLADGTYAKWVGPLCDLDPVDDCSSGPCAAGALCVDHIGHFSCVCHGIRTGKYCESVVLDAVSVYGNGLSVVIGYSMFFVAFTVACLVCTRTRKKEETCGAYATEAMIVASYRATEETEKRELMKFLGGGSGAATARGSSAASALSLRRTRSTLRPCPSLGVSCRPSRAGATDANAILPPAASSTPAGQASGAAGCATVASGATAQTTNPLHLTAAIATLMRSVPGHCNAGGAGPPSTTAVQSLPLPQAQPLGTESDRSSSESLVNIAVLSLPPTVAPTVTRASDGAASSVVKQQMGKQIFPSTAREKAVASKKRRPSAPARVDATRRRPVAAPGWKQQPPLPPSPRPLARLQQQQQNRR